MASTLTPDTLTNILDKCEGTPTQFHGLPDEDLRWLDDIKRCGEAHAILETQWSDVALHFIKDELKVVMTERKNHIALYGAKEWEWEDFKRDFISFCEKARRHESPGVVLETPVPWDLPLAFERCSEKEYVQSWLTDVEQGARERGIPDAKYAQVATHFLPDGLRTIVEERKQHLLLFGLSEWTWADFKQELLYICDDENRFWTEARLQSVLDSWKPAPAFSGIPGEDSIRAWLDATEHGCRSYHIPQSKYTSVAISFLVGDLRTIMQERQRELLSLGSSEWKWESFKTEFISFYGILLRELESWEQPPVFSGSLDEDPNAWLDAISKGCQERQIPEVRHADVAIYFLAGDIKDTMMAIKTTGVQTGSADWSWALFVEEFKRVYQHVRQKTLRDVLQSWEDAPTFGLSNQLQSHGSWLQAMEQGCRDRKIPDDLLTDVAFHFLRGDLRNAVEKRRLTAVQAEEEPSQWTWEVFQQDVANSCQELGKKRTEAAQKAFASFNPASREGHANVGPGALVHPAGLQSLTSGEALPAAVFAVMNMNTWFRRSKSRR